MSWDALGYFDPDKPSFVGHDLIDIDWRGQGRSDGVSTCSGLHDYTGEINSWRLSSAATAAAKACIAKADPAQFALLLDHSVFAADVVALFDSSLTPILPGLIAGLATGDADELVAGFYASRPAGLDSAADFANSCPILGWLWPARPAVAADDHPGLFAEYSNQRLCDAVGPVPQITAPPKITSDIPVLVILSSYDSRSSEAVAKSIFSGFSHASFATATGSDVDHDSMMIGYERHKAATHPHT